MILETAAGIWSSIARPLGNHLWQSAAFAAVAALLAFALRKNQARVRHWLWMAASLKFLVPFAWLSALGSRLGACLIPAAPAPRVSALAVKLSEPFVMPEGIFDPAQLAAAAPHSAAPIWPVVLLAVWFAGSAIILIAWWRRWWRVRLVVRAAQPLREGREWEALQRLRARGLPEAHVGQVENLQRVGNPPRRSPTGVQDSMLPHVRLLSSAAGMEPGIFGILRPILWLPESIADHLSDEQLEAILAHELCHLRSRDNLAAVFHMAVEALFWFHPLVWWIGARLVEERERACDESVVQQTSHPQAYAEGVLKICELYVASPVECAAGVTGADLKKRIEGIMRNRFTPGLSLGKRLLLASAAVLAVAGPVAIGLMNVPQTQAQSRSFRTATTAPVPAAVTARASDNGAGSAAAESQVPPASASQPAAASTAIQVAKPVPLAFEVASIKPIVPGGMHQTGLKVFPGGRVVIPTASLKSLVTTAFDVSYWQFSGGEKWMEEEKYDVEAKPPESAGIKDFRYTLFSISDARLREMLQELLIDRFQLGFHRETGTGDVYVLKQNGKTLRLKTTDMSSPDPHPQGAHTFGSIGYVEGGWSLFSTSMGQLAKFASDYQLHAPVVDRTDLAGIFDYRQCPILHAHDRGCGAQTGEIERPGRDLRDRSCRTADAGLIWDRRFQQMKRGGGIEGS